MTNRSRTQNTVYIADMRFWRATAKDYLNGIDHAQAPKPSTACRPAA